MICETDRITSLKGIGTKKSQAFESMGIKTVKDLVCFFHALIKTEAYFQKAMLLPKTLVCSLRLYTSKVRTYRIFTKNPK